MSHADPPLFRQRAFEEDWGLAAGTRSINPKLAALLWEEGRRWLELGARSDYFRGARSQLGSRQSDSLALFFPAVSELPTLDPGDFARYLTAAREDLTADRVTFLDLLLFSTDQTWTDRLTQVERFVDYLAASPGPQISEIASIDWFILGGHSVLDTDAAGPAYWRSATRAVLAEVQPHRVRQVADLRASLDQAILRSARPDRIEGSEKDIEEMRVLIMEAAPEIAEPRTATLAARRSEGAAGRKRLVAALDQGTTSSRCMIFDHGGQVVAVAQKEHEQIYPKPGWVEHDPLEIWQRSQEVIDEAVEAAGASADDISGLGITNQRETAVVWDRNTGEPVMNAIVWQDTRTDKIVDELSRDGGQNRFRDRVGLPLATYFSGPKVRWMLENVTGLQSRADAGDLLFGNIDSWLIWNLTGGIDGGIHITDVSNASRTMLMDLATLTWDEEIASAIGVPMSMLPEIKPSSAPYDEVKIGALQGIQIAGDLGDQQAATFGQTCFSPGEAKNTYGTGNFLLLNTGTEPVQSKSGLITTAGYKIGDQDCVYCLEGSIAITGALVQWLRDNLKMIKAAPEVEELASTVEDNGGCYIVPAFSGLFAPYWKSNARGVVAGLTRYVNAGHIARAALEATAFQSREVVEAMGADSGVKLESLKVDGGMVGNDLLMRFQADLLGVPVIRPQVAETTALGAAYAAGLATGFWDNQEDLRENWAEDKRWEPNMHQAQRDEYYKYWKKAVTRTLDWFEAPELDSDKSRGRARLQR